jgi:hypothetical protein
MMVSWPGWTFEEVQGSKIEYPAHSSVFHFAGEYTERTLKEKSSQTPELQGFAVKMMTNLIVIMENKLDIM